MFDLSAGPLVDQGPVRWQPGAWPRSSATGGLTPDQIDGPVRSANRSVVASRRRQVHRQRLLRGPHRTRVANPAVTVARTTSDTVDREGQGHRPRPSRANRPSRWRCPVAARAGHGCPIPTPSRTLAQPGHQPSCTYRVAAEELQPLDQGRMGHHEESRSPGPGPRGAGASTNNRLGVPPARYPDQVDGSAVGHPLQTPADPGHRHRSNDQTRPGHQHGQRQRGWVGWLEQPTTDQGTPDRPERCRPLPSAAVDQNGPEADRHGQVTGGPGAAARGRPRSRPRSVPSLSESSASSAQGGSGPGPGLATVVDRGRSATTVEHGPGRPPGCVDHDPRPPAQGARKCPATRGIQAMEPDGIIESRPSGPDVPPGRYVLRGRPGDTHPALDDPDQHRLQGAGSA